MSFTLGYDNAITHCVSAYKAFADETDRTHDPHTDFLTEAQEKGSPPMLDRAFTDRFKQTPAGAKRENTMQAIERLIPGDRISKGLPVPCEVDWEVRQVRIGPNKFEERAGRGMARYDDFVLRWILTQGSRVQFQRQLPGREDRWYEIVAVSPRPPVLSSIPGTISFELREAGLTYSEDADARA